MRFGGTVELAAKHRLPLLLGMHADDTEKIAMVDHYAVVAGDANAPHISAGLAHVADSDAEAVALIRARLPEWLGPGLAGYRRADGRPHRTRDTHDYTGLLCLHRPAVPAPPRRIARELP